MQTHCLDKGKKRDAFMIIGEVERGISGDMLLNTLNVKASLIA